VFDSQEAHREKIDLEACVAVPKTENKLLLAFGSGSTESREWIMVVDWRDNGKRPTIKLHQADGLFAAMRDLKAFSGAGLNIEGAIFSDDHTLRLYQRGNISRESLPSVDATIDIDWDELQQYLHHDTTAVPQLNNIQAYDLGQVNDAKLNFSDAEKVGDAVLYSASAESGTSGENKGSALGVINKDGVRWCQLFDKDGSLFTGKIEGLSIDPKNHTRVWFVID